MAAPHDIAVRSARDRVIDLLGIGDTYPLTDLTVAAIPPKVTYGGTAQVRIEAAQAGVGYQLFSPADAPLGAAEGADADLEIETPKVLENITFRLRATKHVQRADLPAQAPLLLDASAQVKVGLDTGLVIRFAAAPPLDLLDPSITLPQPADPRRVACGTAVVVEVENSQEGVVYTLIVGGSDLPGVAQTGNRQTISLATGPIREDTQIQVRATKHFFGAGGTETEPLQARLFLKVMPDPALAVTAAPPIADYARTAAITIAASQRSAQYRVHLRAIADADFVRDGAGGTDRVVVEVAGKDPVQVRKPAPSDGWALPDGYRPLGDTPLPGTGGDLVVPLPALTADSIVIVQTLKAHRVVDDDPRSATIVSSLRLDAAAVVLVRPDPARALTLRLALADGRTGDTMRVEGGEPGVCYAFRSEPAGKPVPLQAFFHQHDAADASQNKGTGQLAVEVDYSIAAYADDLPSAADDDRAHRFPLPPRLDIAPLAADTRLSVRAWKAQTAVEAALEREALVAAVPAMRADPDVVDHGATARILIAASQAQDLYRLGRPGLPPGDALPGDGGDLAIETDAVIADAVFEVVVTRPADPGVGVERVVQLAVRVRPDTGLAVAAALAEVARNGATEIVVQATQPGVSYQLMAAAIAVGARVPGNGAAIALPTGPITADTTYAIAAARIDQPQITAVLATLVTVTVTPP